MTLTGKHAEQGCFVTIVTNTVLVVSVNTIKERKTALKMMMVPIEFILGKLKRIT